MAPEASSAAGRGPRGDLGLGGRHVLLPRGSLTFSGPRELLVNRTIAGAYETDGSLAPDTVRRVSGGAFTLDSVPRRLASQEVVRVYEEEAVWGGPLATPERRYQTPYGHFMVESVARLWPVLPDAELHGLPVVFVRPQRPPHAAEWLDAFGAPLVDLPEGGAVLFKRLFVPEPAWQEAAWIAPEVRDIHLHARRGMDVPRVSRRGVLWLSRSGLAPTRIPLGEDRLESSLDGRLSAVRPYTMTLAEQVAALEGASAVAGVVGSAFHTLLLTAETPDCLYLCPPWDIGTFPAQHRLLEAQATFVEALETSPAVLRSSGHGLEFPSGFSLSIPKSLDALRSTVLSDRKEAGRAAPADDATGGPVGRVELGARDALLARGSLRLSGPTDLLVVRSIAAAYHPDGTVADETVQTVGQRAFKHGGAPETLADEEIVRVHDEEVVWGGEIQSAYGHFLLESVARLWPLLPGDGRDEIPVVFTKPRGLPHVEEWLRSFGASVVELPERGAVRFRRMLVPEPAWRLGAWIAPEIREIHLHARRGMDVPSGPRSDVLWLSRLGLRSEGKAAGPANRVPYDEALLVWLLGDRISPISPETMTLGEQVGAMEEARAVAGVVGSAFHTLLLTAETPDCLYLCPPWDKPLFPSQHRLLDGRATFARALEVAAWTPRVRKRGVAFPRGFRLLIPEALRALNAELLPTLLDDPRLAAFADPDAGARSLEGDLDTAIVRVLREPLSSEARIELGATFEARGRAHLAREQFAIVSDLHREIPLEYSATCAS